MTEEGVALFSSGDVASEEFSWDYTILGRALGHLLRSARERRGWTRATVVARMPSGIGDRTLLAYEHGIRNMSVLRFMEICHVLNEDPSAMLARAAIHAANLHKFAVVVDMHRVCKQTEDEFRVVRTWATNRLAAEPDSLWVRLEPPVVRELAAAAGCSHRALAVYLSGFTVNPAHEDGQADGDLKRPGHREP
jgi:transcriptional regulator with XRE-family HTH domain